MIGVLMRRGKFGHRHTRKKLYDDDKENGARHLQAKECLGFPRTTRNWEGAIEQIPPQPPKGINPADTLISDLRPQVL